MAFVCVVAIIRNRRKDKEDVQDTDIRKRETTKFNAEKPIVVTPRNPIIQLNPIYYGGKTNRHKKTNYIYLSKRTKLKHKKSWK